jgi:hypothetical protein
MAKIVLIDLEQSTAAQICHALTVQRHKVEQRPADLSIGDLQDADMVFAGGEPARYLCLLRRVRESSPHYLLSWLQGLPKRRSGSMRLKLARRITVRYRSGRGKFTG